MVTRYKLIMIISLVIAYALFFNPGNYVVPIEKLEIISGLGQDLIHNEKGETLYKLTISRYIFFGAQEKGGNSSDSMAIVQTTIGKTIPSARELGQLKSNQKFISALEKVVVIGEDAAHGGIETALDILAGNPFGNDFAWTVVCKGYAEDMLRSKVTGYPTAADYINGMIENIKESNFFSSEYNIMNMYVRVDGEGRSLVVPYLEVMENIPQITGMALFKKDKMVRKIDMDEAKIMNMLRENNVKGILEVTKDTNRYTGGSAVSKRKVYCQKTGDNRYLFTIDLDFKVEILTNTLFPDMEKDPNVVKELEQALQEQYEQQSRAFINKMQQEYQLDALELGRVAAAKYGRGTGVDWDDIVSHSDIQVNIKVKIDRFGRGRYTLKEAS